jgi:hypothetical protein
MFLNLGIHADTSIADCQQDKAACYDIYMFVGILGIKHHIRRLDR